ncbi:hypothetical protein SCMC78_66660 [Streptomyces sp. CMC78]|uniref:Secreted protein n=1 Tax=Streptomyces sp. CMC78 TaxID=3231512 RepID=A0AB33KU17_9ACTN
MVRRDSSVRAATSPICMCSSSTPVALTLLVAAVTSVRPADLHSNVRVELLVRERLIRTVAVVPGAEEAPGADSRFLQERKRARAHDADRRRLPAVTLRTPM